MTDTAAAPGPAAGPGDGSASPGDTGHAAGDVAPRPASDGASPDAADDGPTDATDATDATGTVDTGRGTDGDSDTDADTDADADADAWENTELALAYLRGLRHRHRRAARRQRAYVLYCILLLPAIWAGPYLLAAGRAASEQRWHGPEADRALDAVVAGAPALLALVVLLAARVATWRGPVLLEPPALTWLVPQPLVRAPLLLPPLRASALVAVVTGATLGAVAGYLMYTLGGGVWWHLLAAATGAGAVTGFLIVVVGVWVQRHQPRLLTQWRWWWPAGWGVVGVLALLGSVAVVAELSLVTSAVLWSGPWGWATLPLATVTEGAAAPPGTGPVGGIVGGLLVMACVVLSGRAAWRGALRIPAGVLRAQAGAKHRFSAALYALDPGLARAAARSAWPPGSRRLPRRAVPWPRSGSRVAGWLLVPARDLTGLLRSWGGPVRALCWMTVAVSLLTAPGLPGVVRWLAWLAAFLAVSALAGPARADGDDPRRSAALPWPPGQLALRHVVVPAGLVGGGLLVGVAVAAWVGTWQPGALLLPAAAPALASAVLLDAYRGSLSQENLTGGTGSVVTLVWYLRGTLVALVGLAPAAVAALSDPNGATSTFALVWTAGVTALTAWWAKATATRSARRG